MITRFAPSPTGPLHLGHAFSACLAHDQARAAQGLFYLRIEDIDQTRARPVWEEQLKDDLLWLGLTWDAPPLRQSERMKYYQAALDTLWHRGLLYPCTCKRKDIAAAAQAPQEGAPLLGPDGVIYPGTCRHVPDMTAPRPSDTALRLNWRAALPHLPETLGWLETGTLHNIETAGICETIGDVVLARPGMGTSYHLSVVLDDAEQGITDVIRGADLAEATAIHVALGHLLSLPIPRYHHHALIRDQTGKRLAKRDDARALAKFRAEGASPMLIRAMLGLTPLSR